MKKYTKICALICALATGFSLAGCADTSWALKSGDVTLPSGVYLYYLINNASKVESGTAASSTTTTSSSSSSTSSDVWSKTVDKQNAVSWAINSSLKSCKELIVVEKQTAKRKVKLTSDETKAAKSYADQSYSTYESLFKENDISQTSLERISKDMYLEQELFKSYYGENGDKAVPETELAKYYTQNYAHIKQIFVAKVDTSTNKTLSKSKLASQKKKANTAYAAVKNDLTHFQKYVDKYNEDTGMKSNSDGYIFSKASATSSGYDTKFVNLAFSLKVGQVGMAESDMGYFIEYRVKTDPKASTFNDTMKETILTAMKSDDFQDLIDDVVAKTTFTQNDKTINHYNPKKVKLS